MSLTAIPRTKGENTQERIIDSAFALFARSGFHAVSIRDIAAHAGISHAGLLKHFSGKDELLLRVLQRRDAIEADVQALEMASGSLQLGDFVLGLVRRNLDSPGLVALYVKISAEATDPDHPAHAYFAERYEKVRRRTAANLRAMSSALPQPKAHFDPELAACQLIALTDGLQVQWLLDPSRVDMRAAINNYLDHLGLKMATLQPPRHRASRT